ncbi:hypothetical protein GCM10028857_15840 [Salinarchaeum chitinilyticum]
MYANVKPVVDTWLFLHVLLLGLFGMFGVTLYLLLADYSGAVATIGRAGTAIYLVVHTGYEAIAGVAVGLVVKNGQELPAEQSAGVESTVSTLTGDPMVGAMALLGTTGCLLAVVAIATLSRREGAPLVPLALLFGAPLGLVAHGSVPTGPLLLVIFAIGVTWLEFGWSSPATDADDHA